MKKFLELVAEDLLERKNHSLHELLIIVPGKRSRTFLKHILSQLIEKPRFAPSIFTINEFVENESKLKLIETIPAISLLYQTYSNIITKEETIDNFWYFGEMLLADFDDIDKYLVDAGHLFKYVHDLKEIEQLFDDLEGDQIELIKQFWQNIYKGTGAKSQEKVRGQFLEFWKHLYKIYEAYKKELSSAGMGYEGMLYRETAIKADKNQINFDKKKPVFIGFNALSGAEKQIFNAAKAAGGLFYWDYDQWYLDKKHHEAGYFMRENLSQYPSALGDKQNFDNLRNKQKIECIGVPGELEMAQKTAEIIKSKAKSQDDDPLKNGIILGNESLLTPLLQTLPDDTGKINVTMGLPLQNTSLLGLVKILMQVKQQKIKNKGNTLYKSAWVIEVLQQDIINTPNLKETRDTLVNEKRLFCEVNLLQADPIGSILFPVKDINLIEYLKSILKAIVEYNDEEKNEKDYFNTGAAIKIYSALNQLTQQIENYKLDLPEKLMVRLIDRILSSINLTLEGEPLKGIQIMGLIEARTLDFENLIINAVNEGFLPSSSVAPSFIPYNLRKAYGLLTFENQDAIFAYYFYRAIQRAQNLTLIYNSNEADNDYGEKSRFLQQIAFEFPNTITENKYQHVVTPINENPIVIEKDQSVQPLLNQYLNGKRKIYPIQLNTYLNCPLKFYLQYIAKIKEPEQLDSGIDQRIFGQIFHDTMEMLYKPLSGTKKPISKDMLLPLLNDETILKQINHIMAQQFGNIELQKKSNGMISLIEQVALKYIKRVIENDIKNEGFSLYGLEEEYEIKHQINQDQTITIAGKIDRLQASGNQIFVIDYKTGKVPAQKPRFEDLFAHDLPKRPEAAFQAYLYTTIIENYEFAQNKELTPSLLYIQENRPIHPIIFSGRKKETYADLKNDFKAQLSNILTELFDNTTPFKQTEDSDMCTNCYFKSICHR
ncbi:PD-(D/E)XK nuclease family protein [Salinivirga cyanobacteriivorans]